MYFPQEIDFTITAKRRESVIAILDLTISYRGFDPVEISIDPATITITDAGGVFRYHWEVPQEEPPQLFSRVRYTWDIVTTAGESYTITDDIDFTDQRVNWVEGNDPQSQVNIYHAFNQLDVNDVRNGIRATYNLLYVNADDKPLLNLLVYPENVPIACNTDDEDEPIIRVRREDGFEEIECDVALANRIYQQSDFIVLNQTSVDEIQQLIINLLVQDYYLSQWDEVSVPVWFLSGLQQFYDPRSDVSALTLAQQKARSDELLSMTELSRISDQEQALATAQSIGLVLYLADTIGVEELFEFADSIAEYESFAEAYEDNVGSSLDLLIISWRDWLFRSSSQQDYEYNPYLPDTPTPTATATATNTPTATFTPSRTPVVTNTPRPTATPIPPTPSITPLPAQSFSVQPTDSPPTPIPVEEPEAQFVMDDEFVTRAGVGGGVILILLVLLFFVLRRR